jgi:hypothetical protein
VDPTSDSAPELRALLRIARAELPDRDQLDRVEQQVSVAMAAALAGASAGGSSASTAGAAGTAATKGALGVATTAKLGAVVTLVLAAAAGAGLAVNRGGGPSSAPSAERGGMARPQAPVTEPARGAAPAPARAMAAPATSVHASPPTPPWLDARPREVPVARPNWTQAAPPPSAAAEQPSASPEGEVSLLQRASDAVASAPDVALRLTDQHAGSYPGGALAQERELIAIQALVRLGRQTEARERANQFLRAFPGSAHWPRIVALLGDAPEGSVHNP